MIACAAVVAISACSVKPAPPSVSLLRMSSTIAYRGVNSITYSGKWEIVSGRNDGRYLGRSARSYRPNDCLTLIFLGRRLRIYGVTGRNGGQAVVVLLPLKPERITFRSPTKHAHRLMYDSGLLSDGIHGVSVVVDATDAHTRGYVNLDEFDVNVADRASP